MASRNEIASKLEYIRYIKYILDEREEKKIFFFDNSSLQTVVKGVDDLYKAMDRENFQLKRFQSNHFLICCLASAGLFDGSISILPFHLEEFYHQYKNEFGLSKRGDFTHGDLDLFIKDSGQLYENNNARGRYKSQHDLIENSSKSCQSHFKIANSACDRNWRIRARRLFTLSKIVVIQDKNLQYIKPQGWEEMYKKILGALNRLRPEMAKGRGNENDAFALISFIGLVEQYNQGKLNSMPIFYDPGEYYLKILQQIKINDKTLIMLKDKYFVESFRPESYFIVHSIFGNKQKKIPKIINETVTDFHLEIDDLERTYFEIMQTGQESNFISFQDKIEQFTRYEFLKSIMLNQYGKTDLHEIHEAMKIVLEDYNTKEFKATLDNDLEKIGVELNEVAHRFKLTKEIWNTIRFETRRLKKIIGPPHRRRSYLHIERDFGLMRFGISDNAISELDSLLGDNGMLSPDESENMNAQIRILSYLTLTANEIQEQQHNYTAALCVLWALERYKLISQILTEEITKISLVFSLIKTSALVMLGDTKNRELLQLLNKLEKNQSADQRENLHIFIILAYCHFYLTEVQKRFTTNSITPTELDSHSIKCLNFSLKAYNLITTNALSSISPLKNIYTLNLLIHCYTELGTSDEFSKVINWIQTLLTMQTNHVDAWHFRLDDTLARYYHRLAFEDAVNMGQHLNTAKKFATKAQRNLQKDQTVENYNVLLDTIRHQKKLK